VAEIGAAFACQTTADRLKHLFIRRFNVVLVNFIHFNFFFNLQLYYFLIVNHCVGNFPFAARVVYRTGVSGDDFWQVAKTHGSSAGVHFGRQPTQVFSRPCRRYQSVIVCLRCVEIFDWKD